MSATSTPSPALPGSIQLRVARRTRAIVATVMGASIALSAVSGCTVPKKSSDVVTLAAAQEGKPYRWAAAGPDSFDCSGLVQYVFREAGRPLPRVAQSQYNATLHIPVAKAVPGDLVFWGAPHQVYHVGLYVGGGQMIDAAHPGTTVRQEAVWPGASYGHPLG